MNGKKLKRGIIAPDGYTLIDADSSQIEARVLAWLAEQDDLTQAFANGEDVYVKMASRIYGVPKKMLQKTNGLWARPLSWAQGMAWEQLNFKHN